jgi:hypothetical protein
MKQINKDKGYKEFLVFTSFAESCGGLFNLSSIMNRKPPEPDILCSTSDGQMIAFELFEILDENYAEQFSTTNTGVFAGWSDDPSERKLLKKFGNNNYRSNYPIELLAYLDHTPRIPADIFKSKINNFLNSREGYGVFRKIWVFDVQAKKVLLQYKPQN